MTETKEVPRLSPSRIAKLLLDKSPKHAYAAHRLLGGQDTEKSTASKDLGTAVDLLVFGVQDSRKDPPSDALLKKAKPIAAAVLDFTDKKGIAGQPQKRLEWTETSQGYKADCSAVVDLYGDKMIWDLKTAADLSDHNIVKQIELYHYDMQLAAYQRASGFEKSVAMIFAETSAPYDVRIVTMTSRMQQEGHKKWEKAVRIWSQCMAENHWPGRGSLVADISSYRLKQEPGFVDVEALINSGDVT